MHNIGIEILLPHGEYRYIYIHTHTRKVDQNCKKFHLATQFSFSSFYLKQTCLTPLDSFTVMLVKNGGEKLSLRNSELLKMRKYCCSLHSSPQFLIPEFFQRKITSSQGFAPPREQPSQLPCLLRLPATHTLTPKNICSSLPGSQRCFPITYSDSGLEEAVSEI